MSEPLTDEALAAMEVSARECRAYHTYCGGETVSPSDAVMRLVAEVRRLRSDEWLLSATDEIATTGPYDSAADYLVLAILRKHRDGKA